MKNKFDESWNELMDAWHNDEYACRLELAKKFTRGNPKHAGGWIVLADSLWQMTRYDDAYKALLKAKKMAPDDFRHFVYHQFGHYYTDKGNLARAEIWYRKSIQEKPLSATLIYLGGCLAKQGKFSEAIKYYKKSIKLNTQPPDEAFYNLGLVCRAQRKYKEATEYFKKAIKIDPDYILAKNALEDVQKALKLK